MASVDSNSNAEQESEDMGLQGFICPICLEIYNSPIEINCEETKCPECRVAFDINDAKRLSKLERQMRTTTATCKWCKVNDFAQDDDEMLRAAIAASLEQD
ncbi:hypothetical protein KUTeg_019373 [Tegillarca granosa]|uniref:RING-type domain-containing protein n=1 Tax=Tegillarca granosa TaxID=220873 RepID=A0ABQ9ECE3_TEGGR|nr:hypothetical protein KUTeg_019373 [Tegillarca granosa]